MSSSSTPDREVRISKIAGRYLVFDVQDAMYMRRNHGVCGVLTGTMPQNHTQNIFLSLPVEVRAEEARILVEKKVAYIADSRAAHLSFLSRPDEPSMQAYIQSIKAQRSKARMVYEQARAQRQKENRRKNERLSRPGNSDADAANLALAIAPSPHVENPAESLFDTPPAKPALPPARTHDPVSVTPTPSRDLKHLQRHVVDIEGAQAFPAQAHLNSRGYYFTPGLRFGGDLSIYPGDPVRYHAHFLSKNYGWDEEIPLLDIVCSGRLGTNVKKSFLMTGHVPHDDESSRGSDPEPDGHGGNGARVFSIEWGGM